MHRLNSSSGSPRPLERGANASNSQAIPPQDPQSAPELASNVLVSKLARVPLRNASAARQFLNELALGQTPTDHARSAASVFNDLIEHEAYDLFVDVFDAYNALHRSRAKVSGAPFTTSLPLRLPRDWNPVHLNEMDEALRRVHAQQVVVMRPYPAAVLAEEADTQTQSDEEGGHWPESDGDSVAESDGDSSSEPLGKEGEGRWPRDPAPAALSRCIATLLGVRGGTTELLMHTALEDPETVAKALAHSELQAIELGAGYCPQGHVLSELEMHTCATLMRGLTACSTLTHLSLAHRDLVHLHAIVDELHAAGLGLREVDLVGQAIEVRNVRPAPTDGLNLPCDLGADSAPIVLFMTRVAQFKTLSQVIVHAEVHSTDDLSFAFLEPLSFHDALAHLSIFGDANTAGSPDTTDAMLASAEFSITCPSLTYLAWNAGVIVPDVAEAAYENKRWREGDEKHDRLTPLLKDPRFRLHTWRLIGTRPPPMDLRALFAVLADNKTLVHLDLSGGFMDLNAVLDLLTFLMSNSTLSTLRLPTA